MIRAFILATTLLAAAVFIIAGYSWSRYLRIHGDTETVSFVSADGARLHGRMLTPAGSGPFPAIVLLHGSGPASGTPPFVTAHANAFLDQGIAVLTYDKRGSGQSEGDFDVATYADFIEDAVAAVSFLRKRDEIFPDKVALFGSSESGWFTPEIAARVDRASFIINRAGPPLPWIETNLWEIRNELLAAGLKDEKEIAAFLELRERIWLYYRDAAAARQPLPAARAVLEADLAKIDARWIEAVGMRVADFDAETYGRWLVDILYDPTPFWEKLSIPVLALHGGADQNVPTDDAIAAYEQFRRQDVDIEYVVYPGYAHGMGKLRNLFSMGYPPDYLSTIGRWARNQFYRDWDRSAVADAAEYPVAEAPE